MSDNTFKYKAKNWKDRMSDKQPTDDEIREVICVYLNGGKKFKDYYRPCDSPALPWYSIDRTMNDKFVWLGDIIRHEGMAEDYERFTNLGDPLKSRDAAHLCVDAIRADPSAMLALGDQLYAFFFGKKDSKERKFTKGHLALLLNILPYEISLICYRVIKELERADE